MRRGGWCPRRACAEAEAQQAAQGPVATQRQRQSGDSTQACVSRVLCLSLLTPPWRGREVSLLPGPRALLPSTGRAFKEKAVSSNLSSSDIAH